MPKRRRTSDRGPETGRSCLDPSLATDTGMYQGGRAIYRARSARAGIPVTVALTGHSHIQKPPWIRPLVKWNASDRPHSLTCANARSTPTTWAD